MDFATVGAERTAVLSLQPTQLSLAAKHGMFCVYLSYFIASTYLRKPIVSNPFAPLFGKFRLDATAERKGNDGTVVTSTDKSFGAGSGVGG